MIKPHVIRQKKASPIRQLVSLAVMVESPGVVIPIQVEASRFAREQASPFSVAVKTPERLVWDSTKRIVERTTRIYFKFNWLSWNLNSESNRRHAVCLSA